MIYRIKQFYQGITAKVTPKDYLFVEECLESNLVELFKKLPLYEQKHSINVALTIKDNFTNGLTEWEKDILLKAGLLHDIGKMNTGLNLFTKSLAVVIDKISHSLGENLSRKISFLEGYYNHPEKGRRLLENFKLHNHLLFLVDNHHNYQIKDDKLLDILIRADQQN